MKLFRYLALATIAILSMAGGPVLRAQEPPPPGADAVKQFDANKNISQALAGAAQSAHQTMGHAGGNGYLKPFWGLKQEYQNTGAPFLNGTLNVGLSKILSDGGFKFIYWSFALLFAGFAAGGAMRKAMAGSNPLGDLATLAVKLLFGSVLIAGRGVIYAMLITLMTSMSMLLIKARNSGYAPDTIEVGISDADFDRARMEVVQEKANAVGVTLGQLGAEDGNAEDLEKVYKYFHDGMAPRLKAEGVNLVVTDATLTADAQDMEKARVYGNWLRANAPMLIMQLNSLPTTRTLDLSGSGGSNALAAMVDKTPKANEILAKPTVGNGPAAATAHKEKVENYRAMLDDEVGAYVNNDVLKPVWSESLLSKFSNFWGSAVDAVRDAANSFSPVSLIVAAIDALVKVLGFIQVLLASVITFGACVLIEAQLFVMALMFPFWLHPATEKAFTAPIKAAVGAALWLPAFQLVMMIVDGLYGGLLKAVVLGTGALAGALNGAGGTLLASQAIGAGGLAFAAMLLAFALIYFFIAVAAALKTPGWIKMAMEGGNVAADFLMKQATTVAEGAMLAATIGAGVATAGVGLAAGGAALGGGALAKGVGGAAAKGVTSAAAKSAVGAAGKAAAGAGGEISTTAVALSRAPSAAAGASTANAPVAAPQLATPTTQAAASVGEAAPPRSVAVSGGDGGAPALSLRGNEAARIQREAAAQAQAQAQQAAAAKAAQRSHVRGVAGRFLANTVRSVARSGVNVIENDTPSQWIKNRRAQAEKDEAKRREIEKSVADRARAEAEHARAQA